jgi:hypothetical protein
VINRNRADLVKNVKYDKQDQQGRRRLVNATPTRPSYKSRWQGAQEDPKQKLDSAQGRAWAGLPLKS